MVTCCLACLEVGAVLPSNELAWKTKRTGMCISLLTNLDDWLVEDEIVGRVEGLAEIKKTIGVSEGGACYCCLIKECINFNSFVLLKRIPSVSPPRCLQIRRHDDPEFPQIARILNAL